MREAQPRPPRPEPGWIEADLTEVLASERYQAEDDFFGLGEGHFFGPAFDARLALYPEHKTLEYEDPNVYVVFKKPSRLLVSDEAIFVTTRNGEQWSQAAINRDGFFALMSHETLPVEGSSPGSAEYPIRQTERSEDASDLKASASSPEPVEGSEAAPSGISAEFPRSPEPEDPAEHSLEGHDDRLGAAKAATDPIAVGGEETLPRVPEPSDQIAGTSKIEGPAFPGPSSESVDRRLIDGRLTKEKQPKVRLTGNLVHDVTVARTKTGQPLVKFSLAEHPEPGETKYHKVYSTSPNAKKPYATKIAELGLSKGELVSVVGSEQQHVKMGRDGKPVTREGGEIVTETVIYAYAVKRVQPAE